MGIEKWVPRLKKKKAADGEVLCESCEGKAWVETDFGFLQCGTCCGQGIIELGPSPIHKKLIGPRR